MKGHSQSHYDSAVQTNGAFGQWTMTPRDRLELGHPAVDGEVHLLHKNTIVLSEYGSVAHFHHLFVLTV